MSPNRTDISWCDLTSNPLMAFADGKRGWFCTKVSEGCQNCYAEKLNKRFGNGLAFTEANRERIEWRLNEKELQAVLDLGKPSVIFWEDMGDMFHEDIPSELLEPIWDVIREAPQHTHLLLTKRPDRMGRFIRLCTYKRWGTVLHPLPNLCAMTTAENQHWLDIRVPLILEVPAGMHGVSCEPLLGPIDFDCYMDAGGSVIDWVIAGGESGGPPERALVEIKCSRCGQPEEEHPGPETCQKYWAASQLWTPKATAVEWVRSIIHQCERAGVSVFFKQWPIPPHRAGGRAEIDGHEWRQLPW